MKHADPQVLTIPLSLNEMVLASTSVAGVRFLASIKEGRGLKRSAREAGVDTEVGYRWLRECYLSHRRNGVTAAATKALLGFVSVRMAGWEAEVGGSDRHHFRVDGGIELVFWNAYKSGLDLWEGDLVLGVGCGSAMATLRERTTQYGIIISLPRDHTAHSVNTAVSEAFADLPAHMKRTLTWDQGVEMAKHQDLTAATGVPIFFAERCSPWQRGANENFNGLVRQYFCHVAGQG